MTQPEVCKQTDISLINYRVLRDFMLFCIVTSRDSRENAVYDPLTGKQLFQINIVTQ